MSDTDRFLAALELDKFRATRERTEHLALIRAVRLAPSLDVCEALLSGGRVPMSRIDPQWAERYGLTN